MVTEKKPVPKTSKPKSSTKKKIEKEMPEDIWEQLPTETPAQYAKFCAYRDMAYTDGKLIGKRSIRRTVASMGLQSRQPVEQLSIKNNWVKRCEAYDLEMDRKSRTAQEEVIIKMRKDHADLAAQMIKKAAKRLLTIDEDEISASDIVRLVDAGVKIERLSRGESTENRQISGEAKITHQGNVAVTTTTDLNLSDLSDEELAQLEQLLGKLHQQPGV